MKRNSFLSVWCALALVFPMTQAYSNILQGEFYEARAQRYMGVMEQVMTVAREVTPVAEQGEQTQFSRFWNAFAMTDGAEAGEISSSIIGAVVGDYPLRAFQTLVCYYYVHKTTGGTRLSMLDELVDAYQSYHQRVERIIAIAKQRHIPVQSEEISVHA